MKRKFELKIKAGYFKTYKTKCKTLDDCVEAFKNYLFCFNIKPECNWYIATIKYKDVYVCDIIRNGYRYDEKLEKFVHCFLLFDKLNNKYITNFIRF